MEENRSRKAMRDRRQDCRARSGGNDGVGEEKTKQNEAAAVKKVGKVGK